MLRARVAPIQKEHQVSKRPKLVAPFQWFGGKRVIAAQVWKRLGNPHRYIEPFAGGAAVLLARPKSDRAKGNEVINDMDAFLTNFWRSVSADPEKVAYWVDRPVNEIDSMAWHRWLCAMPRKKDFAEHMRHDPKYHDPQIAGLWCWGLSSWIGSGWCSGKYYGRGSEKNDGSAMKDGAAKLPSVRLGGINGKSGTTIERLLALQERLRYVIVCCGDWKRCMTPAVLASPPGITAVFLDPPYLHATDGGEKRHKSCYTHDDPTVANDVRKWAIENGDSKHMRIALCGYEGEHKMPDGWTELAWEATGGMANYGEKSKTLGINNRDRERIYFSPHCLRAEKRGFGFA